MLEFIENILSILVIKKIIGENTLALNKGYPKPEIHFSCFTEQRTPSFHSRMHKECTRTGVKKESKSFEFAVYNSTEHITELLAGLLQQVHHNKND